MLLSNLLNKKLKFEKANGDIVNDLTRSTFRFPNNPVNGGGLTVVTDFEQMRPDLVANRLLGQSKLWDSLLKFNGISNPFSLEKGDTLYILPASNLDQCIVSPRVYPNRGEVSETNPDQISTSAILDPKTQKDKDRLLNLQKKIGEVLPPNINRQGVQNAREVDGKIVFGDGNTNGGGALSSLARDRVKTSLNQNNIGL
jgi:hypothetical protein